jgi:poly(3-hydroxybutyrate) depolymerase
MQTRLFIGLTLLISCFLFSCQKSEDQSIAFEIKLTDRTDNSAAFSWTDLKSQEGKGIVYKLYLNSVEIAANVDTTKWTLMDLHGKTDYQFRIVASNGGTIISDTKISFTTFENFPPEAFTLITDSISNSSVVVSWPESVDPEKRPINYTIYLNNQIYLESYQDKILKINELQASKKYSIRVVASDDQQNSAEASTAINTINVPNALLINKHLKWDNVDRTYSVYIPSQLTSEMPLVIAFHGAGGYAWPQIQKSVFKDLAEANHFVFVCPQATIYDQPGIPSWNVVDFIQVDDLGFVNTMMDQLITDYPIDTKRIYACGMSSGGYMTYYLALKKSYRLAAIAPVAGLPTTFYMNPGSLSHKLPLLHIHGTKDVTVSTEGGNYSASVDSTLAFFVRNNACNPVPEISQIYDSHPDDGSTITVYKYLSPDYHKEVFYYEIVNGGHSWPGSVDDPSANKDIIAEYEIWNFFKNYSLP